MHEHSPTPWSATPSDQWVDQHDICDGNGSLIGTLDSEDARYAVKCVNAMEGVSIEDMPHVVRLGVHMLAEARRLHEDGYCVTREDNHEH